jgi:hypothetical protein
VKREANESHVEYSCAQLSRAAFRESSVFIEGPQLFLAQFTLKNAKLYFIEVLNISKVYQLMLSFLLRRLVVFIYT